MLKPLSPRILLMRNDHAIAFALGILIDLAFHDTLHDLLSQVTFLIDCCGAIKTPAGARGGVIVEHADMRIVFEIGAAGTQ